MLRPAVLLDAAMTVYEARRRLAQHGLWLDPADDAAQDVLDAFVERRRSAAERASAATHHNVPMPDMSAARQALEQPLDDAWIAIRREEALTVYWYAYPAEHVLHELREVDGHVSITSALNLHETGRADTEQVDVVTSSPTLAEDFAGVVLRGTEFVAVSEPRPVPRMQAPGMPDSFGTGDTSRSAQPSPAGAAPPASAPPPASPPPPTMAQATAPPPADPATRPLVEVSAYPRVEHPEQVAVAQPFDLSIGLGRTVMAGHVDTGPMVLTAPTGTATLPVEIQIVADGFLAPNGWQHVLNVSVTDPFSAVLAVPLIPQSQDTPVKARTITVHFAYDGVTRGSITRYLAVVMPGIIMPPADPRGIDMLQHQPDAPSITVAPSAGVPDIELNIAKADGNVARGTFLCTIRNAHGISVPDAALPVDLGSDPRTFARQLIDEMPRNDGGELLQFMVEGAGDLIAKQLPQEFWQILRDVHAAVGNTRALTLQLNSADPYVPWELALVDPPLDPSRVPVLAAQVSMGRWILGDAAVAAPPRAALQVRSLAVMAGMYMAATSGLKKLPKAEEEVTELETAYKSRGALRYDCSAPALSSLLSASIGGGAQVVHFAGHGQVDPLRPGDAALFLNNGTAINPMLFRRTPLGRNNSPFMFLNACMVGVGGEMLGDYGGFPGNCLAGNFTGLIAPLWAVNDVIAKWVALEFYRQAMTTPSRPVAEIMRDVRQAYAQHPNASSYLAYVYYGNPFLTLS